MKIIVVRHGETNANLENRIQGQSVQGLTEEGREKIKHIGENIGYGNLLISSIYTSDQNRAIETVEILKERLHWFGLTIVDERLREWEFGNLDGQELTTVLKEFESTLSTSSSEIKLEEIADYIYRVNEGHSVCSWTEIQQNISDFLNDLKDSNQEHETVLVVSHGLTMLTIESVINPESGSFKQIPNGFVMTFNI